MRHSGSAGGIEGACNEKVRKIAEVESIGTFMDGVQATFVRRAIQDPRQTEGAWEGGVVCAPRIEGTWEEFDTTADYVAAKALEQVCGAIDCGRPCAEVNILIVELAAGRDSPRWTWEGAIMEVEGDAISVYTNGSKSHLGVVSGGCWVREGVSCAEFLGYGMGK